MQIIQSQVNEEAQNFGIQIVDVGKRADLPPTNSEAIYKECRLREAKEFRHKELR